MSNRGPSIVPRGSGQSVALVGDVYRILVSGKETDGKYAVIETIVAPGGGPPPHRHSREEEGFYILEGELTVTVDGSREIVTTGSFANLPVGSVHSFKNEGAETVRMLITVAPRDSSRCSWRWASHFLLDRHPHRRRRKRKSTG